jgi:hypothetical protein
MMHFLSFRDKLTQDIPTECKCIALYHERIPTTMPTIYYDDGRVVNFSTLYDRGAKQMPYIVYRKPSGEHWIVLLVRLPQDFSLVGSYNGFCDQWVKHAKGAIERVLGTLTQYQWNAVIGWPECVDTVRHDGTPLSLTVDQYGQALVDVSLRALEATLDLAKQKLNGIKMLAKTKSRGKTPRVTFGDGRQELSASLEDGTGTSSVGPSQAATSVTGTIRPSASIATLTRVSTEEDARFMSFDEFMESFGETEEQSSISMLNAFVWDGSDDTARVAVKFGLPPNANLMAGSLLGAAFMRSKELALDRGAGDGGPFVVGLLDDVDYNKGMNNLADYISRSLECPRSDLDGKEIDPLLEGHPKWRSAEPLKFKLGHLAQVCELSVKDMVELYKKYKALEMVSAEIRNYEGDTALKKYAALLEAYDEEC